MNDTSNKTRTVTFCINELDVGGAEKALVRVAIGLKELGWGVRVISLRDAGVLSANLIAAEIPVTALNCGGFADLRCYFRLVAELKRHPSDVVCSFLHQANVYGRLAGKRAKIPVVISGVRVADRRRWVMWTDWLTGRCVDHYVAVGRNVAEIHGQLCGISEDRITAISNGVDLVAAELLKQVERSENEILFVGRLTEQKAPLNLLAAFSKLPGQIRQQTKLTFVGDGTQKDALKAAITDLGLQSSVRVAGHLTNVAEQMQRATLLVLPSLWEGMPNVVLEAMANGLPVLATAVDSTNELIVHNQNGWLVPPGDIAALTAELAVALDSHQLRSEFSESSQVLVSERFSWQSVIAAYDALFRSLLPN